MSRAMYLGVDLGTTNSVAVLSDGERPSPVRTADGGHLLPSVVRVDARGNVVVGARARRFLDADPDNTRSEFKRLMGSGRALGFKASGTSRTPEELSGLVLRALRDQAERALGHAPTAAVVTVPALFELPQIRATSEAARLAGFERVEHLQEPVASALTAGWTRDDDGAPWLVYDLGGGTFDVSLLETREGVLRVIDHDGDNFLGGRDMDARLLDHVLATLSETYGRPFARSDAALAPLLRRLRTACEDAKLELGAGRDAAVSLAEPMVVAGEDVVVDVPIEARTFEALVSPVVDRSIEVCERLLARQGLEPRALGRIVLVGGPTVMPALRDRLRERLVAPLASDVDPMTAVAEGAAFFAAEHGLTTEARATSTTATTAAAAPASSGPSAERVFLQYPSVSGDLYPFVVGRAAPGRLASVRVARDDGTFTSAEEKVDDDGSFVVQVELTARKASTFRLEAKDAAGAALVVEPSRITIRHGVALADPPLSRTIGVALANGRVMVYFERGAPLPSRKTFRLRTSLTVHPGQRESAISIPIVQGEVHLAHLCRLVGRIEVRPEALKTVLPAGSPIDVVLELDRGGKLTATAHLPADGTWFPGALVLVSPETPLPELETRLSTLRERTETLYTDVHLDEVGRKKLVEADARLDDAAAELDAARGGDPDATEKLRRLLIDVDATLADVDALKIWPELDERAIEAVSAATSWLSRRGTDMERRTLEDATRSLERARAMRNAAEFEKRLDNIWELASAAAVRDPEHLARIFRSAAGRVGETRDPRAAKVAVERGEHALRSGDLDGLRRATFDILDLLPQDEHVRARAHGSGVEG